MPTVMKTTVCRRECRVGVGLRPTVLLIYVGSTKYVHLGTYGTICT